MTRLLLATALSVAYAFGVNAQCLNSSRAGIHVIQPGETLYRLSKQYNIPLADLCQWNGFNIQTVLPVCQEVIISSSVPVSYSAQTAPVSYSAAVVQADVKKGDPADNTSATGQFYTVKSGESIAGIADYFGFTEKKLRSMNNLPNNIQSLMEGSVLRVSDCNCPYVSNSGDTPKGYQEGAAQILDDNEPRMTANTDNIPSSDLDAALYMTSNERDMCKEINYLRSNPQAFTAYVREYIKTLQADGNTAAVDAANELIGELNQIQPLSVLRPSSCLYDAAENHANDQVKIGELTHQGTSGSWPWDRVASSCGSNIEGNENLVGGPDNMRSALLALLVDDGISGRYHRRNLLNPQWNNVACKQIGTVGTMPNCWMQVFSR